jgi:prepilin-type N-terminal cleavage/methylation domain-containing protein/prepilin-type processing-associated H-X9-DG protein
VKEARQDQCCQTNPDQEVRRGAGGRRSGFTLIELLITLALMIVIATLYYGAGSPSLQKRQKRLCQQNLQKMYLALEIYATDHERRFPEKPEAGTSEEALDALVPRYTVDTSVFICPGSRDSSLPAGEPILKRQISYAYYMGRNSADAEAVLISDRQVNEESKAAGQPVFSSTGEPPGNNHHKFGGNLLFCDGRVETSGATARFALALPPHVRLLNPKP